MVFLCIVNPYQKRYIPNIFWIFRFPCSDGASHFWRCQPLHGSWKVIDLFLLTGSSAKTISMHQMCKLSSFIKIMSCWHGSLTYIFYLLYDTKSYAFTLIYVCFCSEHGVNAINFLYSFFFLASKLFVGKDPVLRFYLFSDFSQIFLISSVYCWHGCLISS